MHDPLHLLIVEDNPADAELVLRELRRTGLTPEWQRVESEPDFLSLLHDGLDLVISDFDLPQFNGMRALELLRQTQWEIPFILVSGTIGEDVAVEAMRRGATDYLLKDRLTRLGPAARHAVLQGRLRRERRQAEAALHASEERFREITENIHEVFWITDPSKRQMLYISPAYEKIWGRTCASLYAKPATWLEAIHPGDFERVKAAVRLKQAAGSYDEEYRILRPDGTERRIRDRAFPVRDAQGTVLRFVGVAEDVTESRKLQEQFLRSQRLEAIGNLAGGIAHDLNNILAPIVTGSTLLATRLTEARDRQLVGLIQNAANRGTRVVRQMLTYSRGIAGERVLVQCRHLLKEMNALMQETFPRDIVLQVEAAPDLWPVMGDATQIHQVLLNLCVNARDAMPRGGVLRISAGNVELDATEASIAGTVTPGPYIRVTVTDTGQGIAPENLERIFEPFFTTKGPTKGTGLGLSTAIGIIRSHQGYVHVASKLGRGTTFTVHLPAIVEKSAAAEAADGGPDTPPELTAPGGGETILVVDDEEPIRTALELVLQSHGYVVLTAGDGQAAQAVLAANRGRIRLLLTDMMMPVMSGLDLIRAARQSDPALRILATSGLDDDGTRQQLAAAGVNGQVRKPCGPAELLAAIRQQLGVRQ